MFFCRGDCEYLHGDECWVGSGFCPYDGSEARAENEAEWRREEEEARELLA